MAYIDKLDKLNTGRVKLNQAIDQANTVQGQLDTIIVESGTSDAETIQARGGEPLLYNRLDKVDTQLADIENVLDVLVVKYKLPEETTWDNAIIRALDETSGAFSVCLVFPREIIYLGQVETRRHRLTISAYGAQFEPTIPDVFMWSHIGDFLKVEGLVAGRTIMEDVNNNYNGFFIHNDITTRLSSYAFFQDVELNNFYQAIRFYNDGTLGGACYRHKLNNVRIRNWTDVKTRVGSIGLYLGGNVAGDASGNDTKLHDVFIKGYEKNLVVEKSVGTKLLNCGIDYGGVAIELIGGSAFTVMSTYIEYNDTVINLVDLPYRPFFVGCTFANYTDITIGELYNNEILLNYSASSPILQQYDRTIEGKTSTITRATAGAGAGLEASFGDGASVDFFRYSASRYLLAPSDNIDLYEHIPSGRKRYFGNGTKTELTNINEFGHLAYRSLAPASGVGTTSGETSPSFKTVPIQKTENTVANTITRFDNVVEGQEIILLIGDNLTTISHNSYIILKSKIATTYTDGDILKLVCMSAPTPSTGVCYEI